MCNAYTATSFEEAYQQVLQNRIEAAFAPPECFASANKRLERLMIGAQKLFEKTFSVQPYDGTLEPHDAVPVSGLTIQPEFVFTELLLPHDPKKKKIVTEETPEPISVVFRQLVYGSFRVIDEETEATTRHTDIFIEAVNLAHVERGSAPTITFAGLENLLIARTQAL